MRFRIVINGQQRSLSLPSDFMAARPCWSGSSAPSNLLPIWNFLSGKVAEPIPAQLWLANASPSARNPGESTTAPALGASRPATGLSESRQTHCAAERSMKVCWFCGQLFQFAATGLLRRHARCILTSAHFVAKTTVCQTLICAEREREGVLEVRNKVWSRDRMNARSSDGSGLSVCEREIRFVVFRRKAFGRGSSKQGIVVG